MRFWCAFFSGANATMAAVMAIIGDGWWWGNLAGAAVLAYMALAKEKTA